MKLLCVLSLIAFAAMEGSLCAEETVLDLEGPKELLARGRLAFSHQNYSEAEQALEKFVTEYEGEASVAEAIRLHVPLLALSKVGVGKYEEAKTWIERSLKDPKLDRRLREELQFMEAVCLISMNEWIEAQHDLGRFWTNESHSASKRYESLLLFASLYLPQEFPEVAAQLLSEQIPKIRRRAPEAATRGIVLELHARIEAGEMRAALALIERESPNLDRMTQAVSFQLLVMKLGNQFLDADHYYEAIRCFQRTRSKVELIALQEVKREKVKANLARLGSVERSQSRQFQLRTVLKRLDKELEQFRAMDQVDASIQLRLAKAYQGLGRYREAALIMGEMLESMPPSLLVEKTTLSQIQCWMAIGCWSRVKEVAERYESVFGVDGESFPMVLYLQAEAFREMEQFGSAQLSYGRLIELFPQHALVSKAVFMQGFLYLLQDDPEGALYQFAQVERLFPDSAEVEEADYWTGMALSYSGRYDEARVHLSGYQDRFEHPRYRKEAEFRCAVCTFSLAEYTLAIEELSGFIAEHSEDPLVDEANLLLGDAYLAEGEIERGFQSYDRVREESGRFYEEAWFKKGNAYQKLEDLERVRAHFQAFVKLHPESDRLPEAVYWIGWAHLREGDTEACAAVYWDTIEEFGSDPDKHSILDVFAALTHVYRKQGEAGMGELLARLKAIESQAASEGDGVMELRAVWARANVLASQAVLLGVRDRVDPKSTSPVISVDVAEALFEAGVVGAAEELLKEVRRWNPRSIERARVYRNLARIEVEKGDFDRAVEFYDRFERSSFDPEERAKGKFEKVALLELGGQKERVRAELESVLKLPKVSARMKAQALQRLGESFVAAQDDSQAIVYFERVYVSYSKFSELNAQAYWQRGQSLERLDLSRLAMETYEELLEREELSEFPEAVDARERLASLRVRYPAAAEETLEEVSL